MGSIAWARSHQTVAFCLRIKVTYEVGLFVATDRPEVDRRGMLAVEPVVPCRCMAANDCVELLEETDGCIGGLELFTDVFDGVRECRMFC